MRVANDNSAKPIDFHLSPDSADEVRSIVSRYNSVSIDHLQNIRDTLDSLFTSCTHLCKIQLNVQNTGCALGYSRFVVVIFSDKRVKNVLRLFAEEAQKVESLDFLSTANDKERQILRSAFPKFMRKHITFHGQCDPDNGDWDPKVEIVNQTPSGRDFLDSIEDSSPEGSFLN
jgi:hypothetical protein